MGQDRLNKVIIILREQLSLLETHIETLKHRRERLFNLTVKYVKNRRYKEAQRIANEAALVDRVLKLFNNLRIALDAVILRLETIREVGELRMLLTPVIKVLEAMSNKTEKIIPDFSESIDEAQQLLFEILSQPLRLESRINELVDEETERVEEEAKSVALEIERDQTPIRVKRRKTKERE